MEKKQKNKWYIFLIVTSGLIILGFNLYADYSGDNITTDQQMELIFKVLGSATAILLVVLQLNTGKIQDIFKKEVRKSINNIDEKVHAIDNKMIGFDNKILNIEDQEIAWKNSLKEIESGQAQSEQRQLYIFSHVQHTVEINELCVDIDAETNDYFEEKTDLDSDLKDYIIEVNGGISNIIKNQYERGFKKFKVNYFKSKLLNNLKACTTISLLETLIKDEISKDIKENICKYTNDLKLILANKDNGERREDFIKTTLRLTEKINKRSLDKYNKFQIKTA